MKRGMRGRTELPDRSCLDEWNSLSLEGASISLDLFSLFRAKTQGGRHEVLPAVLAVTFHLG